MYCRNVKGPFAGAETLKINIEVVEPIGPQVILLASAGTEQLTACADPQTAARPHMQMEILVDMNHMHLFDKDTGKAFT
jgi:multiple sugar transport system ATP-binding protein